MGAELLVNVAPFETRIARIENGRVEEVYIERERERGLRGNIYKGRVQRVLPGIQAAFVDLGIEKAGFLYAGDIAHPSTDVQDNDDEETNHTTSVSRAQIPINEMIKEGQEVIVQVTKEPIASKGARISTLLSLPGRYLVFLPYHNHVGIARRIEDKLERERLLEIGHEISNEEGGLIIRTVAEGHAKEELEQDLKFLQRLWKDIDSRTKNTSPANMLHTELNLYLRVMRDFVDDAVEKIHVDSHEAYERMKNFAQRFMPEVADRLYYYPGERPIFDVYAVENEINQALQQRVPLKSGGYLIIDQNEALTAIDVNSGSFVHSRNLEETSFKTNLEAVHEIVHQLRLRNLGGIIVLDFIDMQEEDNRQRLLEVLDEALSRDKSKTQIVQYSQLGLVEMTRKRTRESLGRTLLCPCSHCTGTGYVKSMTTICYQIFREVVAEARAYPCQKLMVIAHPNVIDLLLGEESARISKIEGFLQKEIMLKSDEALTPDQYEVALI